MCLGNWFHIFCLNDDGFRDDWLVNYHSLDHSVTIIHIVRRMFNDSDWFVEHVGVLALIEHFVPVFIDDHLCNNFGSWYFSVFDRRSWRLFRDYPSSWICLCWVSVS